MPEKCSFIDLSVIEEKSRQIPTDFLAPILDKPLTVERIDNYADDAVNELIFLLNQKVDDYKSSHNTGSWDDKAVEDATLKFYGLENIGEYLDFLAEKDAEIRGLDRVIKKAEQVGEVVVRPDSYNLNIVGGNGGEIKEKKMISRVKTVLFILKEDFEVDVNDENQLTLKKGILKDNMMRKTSYFLISAPNIDRTLLVCDEEGNASYVFNNKFLKDREISEDILINSTKEELNELIRQTPDLGKRVIYSRDDFVSRMIKTIENPDNKKPDEITKEMGRYLYKKPSDGELSCSGLAKILEIDKSCLDGIIKQIDSKELGVIERRRVGPNIFNVYSSEQQELIIRTAEQKGIFAPPPIEDELPCVGLAHRLRIGFHTLEQLIRGIDTLDLGKIEKRKFGGIVTSVYSSEQQELIARTAEQKGILAPQPKEDELSCRGLAEKLGISKSVVKKIIEQIDPVELGKVEKRKFGPNIVSSYNLRQQEIITRLIGEGGFLSQFSEEADLSCKGLAEKLGISKSVVKKIIEQIDPVELGKVEKRKFAGHTLALAYNLRQQEIITRIVEEKGLLLSSSKDGEMSCLGLSEKLGLNNTNLSRFIERMDPTKLGKVEKRKFNGNVTSAYSLEQQEKIIEQLYLEGLLALEPIVGELSVGGLAEKVSLHETTIRRIVSLMDQNELGKINLRRFNTRIIPAYNQEQQEKIIEYIREHKRKLISEDKWKELDEEKKKKNGE